MGTFFFLKKNKSEKNKKKSIMSESSKVQDIPKESKGEETIAAPAVEENKSTEVEDVLNPPKIMPEKKQSSPPTIPVSEQFTTGSFPYGEIQEYRDDNKWRTTSAEKRAIERMHADTYQAARHGAEVHRQVRQYMQSYIKPGLLMTDICKTLEGLSRKLVVENGFEAGIAFPTGCSWTWAPDPKYKNLLDAVKDATNTGIKTAGIDVKLCDVGSAIQEVMESYEIELNGKTFQIKVYFCFPKNI